MTLAAGGVQTTGSLGRLTQENLKLVFGQSYNKHPAIWSAYYERMDSQKNLEYYQQFENFSAAGFKREGEDILFDNARAGMTPIGRNLTAALGFINTMEAGQDDKYNTLDQQTSKLGYSMSQLKERTGANLLNNAFDAAFTQEGGDGSSLISTSHISGPSGGTYSNRLPVDAHVSETAFEDMKVQVREAKDIRGNQANIMTECVIVSPTDWYDTKRILDSVLQNDTGNNATNVLYGSNAFPKGIVENVYLDTGSTAWFFKTDGGGNPGLVYQERMAIEFEEDNTFSSGNHRHKAVERYAFLWVDPHGIYGSDGST